MRRLIHKEYGKKCIGAGLLLLLLIGLSSGCGSAKQCCADHETETEAAKYCNAHRDAVVKYVRAVTDNTERRARLESFKDIFDQVKFCRRIDCLERDIYDSGLNMDEFSQRYALDHELAEQNIRVRSKQKVDLILCGFRSGIQEMEAYLTGRGY